MIHKNIIIVGAGAAGLFAGLNLEDSDALILEKMPTAGKKLLMAGSGKCNITHEGNVRDFIGKYGTKSKFIKPALLEYPNDKLIQLLNHNAMPTISKENGKVFPKSESSKDVLQLLLKLNQKAGTTIRYNQPVKDIVKNEERFYIKTENETYSCNYLIMSPGGSSYPETGSDGTSYSLAKKLGHSIVSLPQH